MGLPFPAGAHIEKLALENKCRVPKKKPSITDFKINLSGLENMAIKLFTESQDKALVSAFVLEYIGEALSLLSENYINKFGDTPFVYSGGVMSNSIIRKKLANRFNSSFAEPMLSADNAVGIAALTVRQINKK